MTVFLSTLEQMGFLILLIAVGFIVVRLKAVPETAAGQLSRLENNIFIPALVLGTFIKHFTVERIIGTWQYLVCGLVVITLSIPVAIIIARLCSKDEYIRRIYTYGLAFSNFGFMGNAVVLALFPDVFMDYLIFVLPFWVWIYVWAVPSLLIADGGQRSAKQTLKNLLNPMFVSVIVGMVIGLINPPIPSFIDNAVTTLGNCMSPIAMLLTGMTVAQISFKRGFTNLSVYAVSVIRLFIIPLAVIGLLMLIPIPYGLKLCTVCSVAMPLGLNTIVVPSAYGKDTTVAAGMALISHLMSCLSIPLVFMIFELTV